MRTDISIHNIKSVEITNTIFDGFETIKILIADAKGHNTEVNIFSKDKRFPLDVIKAFNINGSNSKIVRDK